MVPKSKGVKWPLSIVGCCLAVIATPVIVLALAPRGTARKLADIGTPRSNINRETMRKLIHGMPESDLPSTLGKPHSTNTGVSKTTGKSIVGREYV